MKKARCLICGQSKLCEQTFKWKSKKFLFFWRKVKLGICYSCWFKAMVQIYSLFKEDKERHAIYLKMVKGRK